jgi:PAS domain S-box-containing protein
MASSSSPSTLALCPAGKWLAAALPETALLIVNETFVVHAGREAEAMLNGAVQRLGPLVVNVIVFVRCCPLEGDSNNANDDDDKDLLYAVPDLLRQMVVKFKDSASSACTDVEAITRREVGEAGRDRASFRAKITSFAGPCPCGCAQRYASLALDSDGDTENPIRDMVDASFDPMFQIDSRGMILLANQAATDMFGYTRDEFLGRNISLICARDEDKDTSVAKVIDRQRQVLAKTKDGDVIPIQLGVKEMPHHDSNEKVYFGFVKDLRPFKQHEDELQHREALFQGMINASFDPMFQIDVHGTIQTANQAAVDMFGYDSVHEFVGENISILCGGDHGRHHSAYMERYLETGEKRIIGKKRKVQAKRKDGLEFDIELGVQEVVTSDGTRTFCGYMRDLTQQNMDKRALRKHQEIIHGKFFADGRNEGEVENNGDDEMDNES